VIVLRRRRQAVVDAPVSDEERQRVEQLLSQGGRRSWPSHFGSLHGR
jgi:hypothetical protein